MLVQKQMRHGGYKAVHSAICVMLSTVAVVGAVGQSPNTSMNSDRSVGSSVEMRRQDSGGNTENGGATSDLIRGGMLTRQGKFAEAIPLLRRAQAAGIAGYAGEFNLALSYVATDRFREAVEELHELQRSGQNTAAVNNLLAQAYLGIGQQQNAWNSIQAAVKLTPKDEKMYAFLMNACTDHYQYELGLKVASLGLQSLPNSARLHYERAVFLARLDRLEEAKPEFSKAAALDPKGDLGYLSQVQVQLYDSDLTEALKTAHDAVKTGHRDYQMLALLGTLLMQAGAIPGQPEFVEAKSALETSVTQNGEYSTSQIALGKLYLMDGRANEAIAHLEVARRLEPQNPAVYTNLAAAYRRVGNKEASARYLQTLAALLREKTNAQAENVIQP